MVNIGINGFGRIGKLLTRLVLNDPRLKLISVNHPTLTKVDYKYLLKYDSVHGSYNELNQSQDSYVKIHNHREPKDIIWEDEIDIIFDTTGKFKTKETLASHKENTNLDDNTIVLLTAPPKDDIPMFVYGVNHMDYNNQDIISAASCTTTCLAPIAKILNDNYTITNGLATTIHSVTASQYTVDKYTTGKRTGRSVINNIIPSTTGAAKAIGKVIPELNGTLDAVSVRVPVSNVSLIDLNVNLEKSPEINEILKLFKNLSRTDEYRNIIQVCDDLVVSSDFIGNANNSIVDSLSTMKVDNMYKFLVWYDNEFGYANNIIRFVKYLKF